jgi:excisionase family DNA binding protein
MTDQIKNMIRDAVAAAVLPLAAQLARQSVALQRLVEAMPAVGVPVPVDDDDLLEQHEVAKLVNVKTATLEQWRHKRRNSLPFIKIGHLVRYRRADVAEFITSRAKNGEADQA